MAFEHLKTYDNVDSFYDIFIRGLLADQAVYESNIYATFKPENFEEAFKHIEMKCEKEKYYLILLFNI